MRWSYKSVHYDYKKEGLLGGTFLDEAEIEQSMNEFGQAGWELVALLEAQDGLMAIFKQPLDIPARQNVHSAIETKQEDERALPERGIHSGRVLPASHKVAVAEDMEKQEELAPEIPVSSSQVFRSNPAKAEKKRPAVDGDGNGGVGSIRIE
jgi:hypothetical protein